ncbi:hypothetical protein [Azorhizophilus paspali]|uniref:hypothetical protein n=1 Tax=Azorhizophilus paspali TaxID=69963 RepID=UPI00374A2710
MYLYPVSVSLFSYGASLVRERGQAYFLPLLAQAGAARAELRDELFATPLDPEAPPAAVRGRLYSLLLTLWTKQGKKK